MRKVSDIKISKLSIYEGVTKLTTINALQPNFLQWKSVSSLISGAASVPDDIQNSYLKNDIIVTIIEQYFRWQWELQKMQNIS